MAVTIRLARHGQKKRPFYRIVAADIEMKRDGRFLEILGTYNSLQDPPLVNIKEDRIKYWISQGATTTRIMGDVIKKNIPGLLEERDKARVEKRIARRKNRRAAMKKTKKARMSSERAVKKAAKKKAKSKAA